MPKALKSKEKKQPKSEDKTFDSRSAAFREAKRDMKIPMGTQPAEVLSPNKAGWKEAKLDSRNKRLYIFRILEFIFGKRSVKEVHIREDKGAIYPDNKGNQLDHFNAGIKPKKLKRHYCYKEKNKNSK